MGHKKLKNVLRFLADLLFFGMIALMLGGAFVFFISSRTDKSFYGYRFYEVLTNSMRQVEPSQRGNFVAGDMIVVKLKQPDEIVVGDIITFVPNAQAPDTYLSHRVKRIEEEVLGAREDKLEEKSGRLFITQGDANNLEDPPLREGNIIGKVEATIPKGAIVVGLIRDNALASAVFGFAFFAMLYILKGYFLMETPETKEKARRKKGGQRKKRKRRRHPSQQVVVSPSRKRKRKVRPISKTVKEFE